MQRTRLSAVLLLSALAGACGSDDSDGTDSQVSAASDFCSQDGVFCGSFFVDPDESHSFRKFSVIGFEEEVPTRPPDVRLAEIFEPEIVDGEIRVEVELDPYRGDYYIWGILYNEADPSPLATPELDYTGQTSVPVTLDGSAVNIEDVTLQLEPPEAEE